MSLLSAYVGGCHRLRSTGWRQHRCRFTSGGQQRGVGLGAETMDLGVQLFDLCGECLVAAGQHTEGLVWQYLMVVWAVPGQKRGADLDMGFGGKTRKDGV